MDPAMYTVSKSNARCYVRSAVGSPELQEGQSGSAESDEGDQEVQQFALRDLCTVRKPGCNLSCSLVSLGKSLNPPSLRKRK